MLIKYLFLVSYISVSVVLKKFLTSERISIHIMESVPDFGPRVLAPNELGQLKVSVLKAAVIDTPQLKNIDPNEVNRVLDRDLAMLQEFEGAALPHPQVHPDTDVVFIVPGPGEYSLKVPPYEQKPDRYQNLPWARKMDRARVRVGLALVREITAQRLGKNTQVVTTEDIVQHGPWLHYSTTHWENEHIKGVLSEQAVKIPSEKIIMYEDIVGNDGKTRPIVNTADQLEGLNFQDKVKPRRIAVVSHAPHLVRIMHMMEKFKARIPAGAVVQPFPLPTPVGGVPEYARMELQGTLAGIYKLGTASPTPYPYQL